MYLVQQFMQEKDWKGNIIDENPKWLTVGKASNFNDAEFTYNQRLEYIPSNELRLCYQSSSGQIEVL